MSALDLLVVGPLHISASRWPGMENYDWKGMVKSTAPLNAGGARFGGGWRFSLGIETAGWSETGIHLHLDLLYGSVSIKWTTAAGRKANAESVKWWEDWRVTNAVKKAVDREVELKNAERDSMQKTHAQEVEDLRIERVRLLETMVDRDVTDTELTKSLQALHDACHAESTQLADMNIVYNSDEEREVRVAVVDATTHAWRTLEQYGRKAPPPEPVLPVPRALSTDDEIPF